MYIEYFENKIKWGIRHMVAWEPKDEYLVTDFVDALDELVADNQCCFESDEETIERLLNTKATAPLTRRLLRWRDFAWRKYFEAIG